MEHLTKVLKYSPKYLANFVQELIFYIWIIYKNLHDIVSNVGLTINHITGNNSVHWIDKKAILLAYVKCVRFCLHFTILLICIHCNIISLIYFHIPRYLFTCITFTIKIWVFIHFLDIINCKYLLIVSHLVHVLLTLLIFANIAIVHQ